MKKYFLSIAMVLMIFTQAAAETSVWKAQKGDSVMYLGGTFHMLRPSDYPLPVEFEKAYGAADVIVFETDIGKLSDPAIQQKMMLASMYRDGTTIEDYLTESTYKRLAEYCTASGFSMENMRQFKPSLFVLTMTVVELAKLGISPEGVDVFFYKKGMQDQKTIEKLETVDQQIDFITSMGDGYEEAFVVHSLKDLDSVKQKFNEMVSVWRKGDAQKIDALILRDLRKQMPVVYKELLLDRNKLWLPMIEAYGKTPQKEFILVGVGHLVGKDGIVQALRQKGYKVEKL